MAQTHVLFAGRTTLDVLYCLDRLPEEDTKAYARTFHAAPGGPACNAAITCALLGGEAALVSAVGQGPWAEVVRDELKRRGIRLIDMAAETEYETPLTTVLVSSENSTRTIVNPPPASAPIEALEPAWNPQWGEMPRVMLTDGFHLKETLPFLNACHKAGAALCLDGGSWKPGTEELAPLLTAAVCSERFSAPGARPDAEGTLGWFAERGVPCAAVTRGPRAILGLERGRRFEVEIPEIEAVDTSGAGDVLHGAFCYEFARSGAFEPSLRFAAEVASRSCRSVGIGGWAAT